MMKQALITVSIIAVLAIAASVYFFLAYRSANQQLAVDEKAIAARTVNSKVLNFARLFIDKVLKAQGEVSFDDRLQLENTVRDLGDPDILNEWNTFVNSKTELDAQNAVKDLLSLFLSKIKAE